MVRARSKRSKEDSLPQETGRAKSRRYIILLKVKRVCRLDQNTVTMALRRVFPYLVSFPDPHTQQRMDYITATYSCLISVPSSRNVGTPIRFEACINCIPQLLFKVIRNR